MSAAAADVMLGNGAGRDLPSPSSVTIPIGSLSPNTQNRIIDECGGVQTMCELNFDLELDFDNIEGDDDSRFDQENPYAKEMAQIQNRRPPSVPNSPIDVTADCPDPIQADRKPYKLEVEEEEEEYFIIEEIPDSSSMKTFKRSTYSPYSRPMDMTPKPRGRPPKQVADTKRAQLAKNWRIRKQEEENLKTQRLAMYESELADNRSTIDMLTQENNDLRKALQTAKSKSSPYTGQNIIKKEIENKRLAQENQELTERYDLLFAEFQELKGIVQGVMWNGAEPPSNR